MLYLLTKFYKLEVDEVLCDGKKIAQMAVEHLISLGHRNIGYVGGCRNEDRYVGYLDTLKENNLDVIPEYVVETDQTEREGYEAMEKLLKSEDCPTGHLLQQMISRLWVY